MCQAFGQAAFPVDTHIHRLAQRWGLTDGRNVEQTEAGAPLFHVWVHGMGCASASWRPAASCRLRVGTRCAVPVCASAAPSAPGAADLKLLFPERLWKDLHLQIIFFGTG